MDGGVGGVGKSGCKRWLQKVADKGGGNMGIEFQQKTIGSILRFGGKTLHGGGFSRLIVHPAQAGGIVFIRTDIPPDIPTGAPPNAPPGDPTNANRGNQCIPALWKYRVPSELCTQLRNDAGVSVATVEHLLAALAGCGIDHARIEIDGDELPALDGSAAPYTEAIIEAGITPLPTRRRWIKLCHPLVVEDQGRSIHATPADDFSVSCRIEFDYFDPQHYRFTGGFRQDIAPARTFCFAGDIEAMRARGLALGGSLDNAVVIARSGAINPGGLRFTDECVRHKILDMIGDLSLAGAPILADIRAECPGHALTYKFLQRLMMDDSAWAFAEDSNPRHLENNVPPIDQATVAA